MQQANYDALGDVPAFEIAITRLGRRCRVMRDIHRRTGTPPLRSFTPNFQGLSRVVVGQQLSAQSAAAIWARVESAVRPFNATTLAKTSDEVLKGAGLSAGKIKTLRALSQAVAGGSIRFANLNRRADDDIRAALVGVHGIGPWTADIYLLFALKRADAFPSGDLALQIATQRRFGLGDRPAAAALLEIAERWRPWRGVAAHLLWADYALGHADAPPQAPPPKRSR